LEDQHKKMFGGIITPESSIIAWSLHVAEVQYVHE
jgi:hypothetical protein